jgi:NAD(P)-dependent dehydrogenase (short-subunit alcohol dehydrogenase family)
MATQSGTGSIINISSGASHPAGAPTLVSYGAAKAGLNHMTRSLAEEWGPRVRVNCLALGATMTDNFQNFVLSADDPAGTQYFRNVPLRRAGTPDEVGAACVFLCSGQADYINGTTIEMDGGMLPGTLYETGIQTIEDLLAGFGDTNPS